MKALPTDRIEEAKKTGKELSEMRRKRGIKASWVADQIGITRSYLSDLESGNRYWTDERIELYKAAIGA